MNHVHARPHRTDAATSDGYCTPNDILDRATTVITAAAAAMAHRAATRFSRGRNMTSRTAHPTAAAWV